MRVWVAKLHEDGRIVAIGKTYKDCSVHADDIGLWDQPPGTIAPYYFTTANVIDCQMCIGSGKLKDYDIVWDCPGCRGSGIIEIP